MQTVAVDAAYGSHECVELSVAGSGFLVFPAVNYKFYGCRRAQAVSQVECIVGQMYTLRNSCVFKYVGNNERQVALRYNFLFVGKLDNAVGYFTYIVVGKFYA